MGPEAAQNGCLPDQATTYLQLIGVLLGQLLFGFLGDAIGRRTAMLLDMAIILAGVILLTCAAGPTPEACSPLPGMVFLPDWCELRDLVHNPCCQSSAAVLVGLCMLHAASSSHRSLLSALPCGTWEHFRNLLLWMCMWLSVLPC